ncbi:MAG TPA: response regulator [Terriglobales bacterium]|nr:response regulator [Terriglobales bacterium]
MARFPPSAARPGGTQKLYSGAPNSAATILIVDDTESSVAALEIALAQIPGVEVAFVSSPAEVLRSLKNSRKPVSAIVTDICMPAMNGFELIRQVRADRQTSTIPIVVVTADTNSETPERTTRPGANAFIAKPFAQKTPRRTSPAPSATRRTAEQGL